MNEAMRLEIVLQVKNRTISGKMGRDR